MKKIVLNVVEIVNLIFKKEKYNIYNVIQEMKQIIRIYLVI